MKEIKTVDEAKGIVRITTVDERFYARPGVNATTGLPEYQYYPAVTWICGYYPRGIGYMKWLAANGWDEAKAIKEAAGDRGSRVHQACAMILDREAVEEGQLFTDAETGAMLALPTEEYASVLSFVRWLKATQPVLVKQNFVIFSEALGCAGTLDLLCLIEGKPWLIDLKTSQEVFPPHEIQVSAYGEGLKEAVGLDDIDLSALRLGILQVGYRKNKAGYRFTEVQSQVDLFLATKAIWAKETAGQAPAQKDYPLKLGWDIPLPDETESKVTRKPKGVPA